MMRRHRAPISSSSIADLENPVDHAMRNELLMAGYSEARGFPYDFQDPLMALRKTKNDLDVEAAVYHD